MHRTLQRNHNPDKQLKINPEFFITRHDASCGPTGSILRMLWYPSITSLGPSGYKHNIDFRCGAHSDYGTITLLFQRPGQPGLEILTPEGIWAPVPVWPQSATSEDNTFPPILIN